MEGWHSFIHPKSCSHAGTSPSFDKISIIGTVKISHSQTDIFPPQYIYESTTGRNCILLLIWKPQGFSAPCRGKEETNNICFIFSEPCCLTHHLRKSVFPRDWKEQEFPQSKWPFSPAAFNLFYSPFCGGGTKKCVALYSWNRKIKMAFFVEAQKLIL